MENAKTAERFSGNTNESDDLMNPRAKCINQDFPF